MVKHVFCMCHTRSKKTATKQMRIARLNEWKWLTKSTSHNKHCC